MSAAWRWEFRRYDYRRQNFGRGWLQYVGLGPVLLVVGFHRNRLYRKRGRYWRSSRPFAASDYVIEANEMRPVRFFSAEALDVTKPFDVVSSDPFDRNVDLPSPGERLTVAVGKDVLRGTVRDIVFLVEVDREP